MKTVDIFAEYFGVGVTSVAMDGVAPELNPGWVHRRTNTLPKVRHATEPAFKSPQPLSSPLESP
ncbi:MAG TPA: hypothetical protein VJY57_10285 [Thiopseudomonas sp.]|nr:hypothetical protein [Thiopseudomonas sp.]